MFVKKYHINPKSFDVGECGASEGNCPFGKDEPHYTSVEIAEKVQQQKLTEKYGVAQTLKKRKNPDIKDYFPSEYDATIILAEREECEKRWKRMSEKGIFADPSLKYVKENKELLLTPVENAPKSVSVYRSGDDGEREYSPIVAYYGDLADYDAPPDYPSRTNTLYSSVGSRGLRRWMNSNASALRKQELSKPYEITVDPNKVMVFKISAWDDFSWNGAPASHFWDSGILLSRFEEVARKNNWDESEWEVMVPRNAVQKMKPLTQKRFTDLIREELNDEDRVQDGVNLFKRIKKLP